MTDTSYKPIEAAQKVLRVIDALKGNEFDGLTPKQICELTGLSGPQVGSYLETLRVENFAERMEETGRWRLSAKCVQIAVAFSAHMTQKRKALEELEQRYTRTPG
jgi:DNA-binding IclR family transcriptional regulator